MHETNFYKNQDQGSKKTIEQNNGLNQLRSFADDIVDTVRDPLLVLASDLKVVFANPSFYKTFNTCREETVDRFIFDLGNQQWDIPKLRRLLEKVIAHNTVFRDFEVEHDFKLIGKRIMHINARKLNRKKNHSNFILLSIEDVTDRITMERNLREYQNQLEQLVEFRSKKLKEVNQKLEAEKERLDITLRSIGDAVIATDIEGKITLINHAAEILTGWSWDKAVGKPLSEVLKTIDQKSQEPLPDPAKKIIESKGFINIGKHLTLIAKDGQERIIADSGSPIWDTEGRITGTVLVFRDITEEKKIEDKLRQSHKMESIGTLAGGIAHDFNNILFAIMGYTDLAMLEQTEDSEIFPSLEGIYKACNRAKDLVQQILTFSRQGKQVFKPVEISPVIKEAVKLIRASLPSTIQIESNINSDSKIIADATQIYQVIYNLCINAAQAIQDEMGLIRVCLTDTKINKELSLTHPELRPGNYVKLSVVDSGHGITPKIKDKIFDPYFTTKQLSKGTGLGLAVVLGIITNHDGAISVFSEPGKGTTFDVYFPVIERKEKRVVSTEPFEPLPMGNENILLVDDEEQIIQMERQMLEKLGYKVTTRISSRHALETFVKLPNKFDLVITDMTMPGMTGYQLSKKIKKIRPDIPIILCSGYTQYISEEKIREIGVSAFVLKPMTMIDLSKITRKILDRKIYERRQNERFRIKEKAIAITKSDPVEECEIVDISWGGLAICSYTIPGFQKRFNELAINIVDKGILLDKVPCKVISDLVLTENSYSGIEEMKKRQGIQFGKLAQNQLNVLDHLIHSYTVTVD